MNGADYPLEAQEDTRSLEEMKQELRWLRHQLLNAQAALERVRDWESMRLAQDRAREHIAAGLAGPPPPKG